jgi:hypothetical protein
MRSSLLTCFGAAAVTFVSSVSSAWAAAPPVPGTRSLGFGGALRGAATGDSGLTLNPSGMSLMRAYVIEAAYAHDRIGGGSTNLGRLSIVDSTSGFNIAGGVYYNYLADAPAGGLKRSGHEGGVALAIPIGEHVFLGGTVKYFRLRQSGTLPAGTASSIRGFTFDAGLTLKPVGSVSIGITGQNLADLHTDRAPRTVGGGLAVGATTDLLFAVDAVLDLTSRRDAGGTGNVWHVMGGAEYLFAKQFALRAGGGRRGNTRAGYLAAGASYIGQVGAVDFGFQQDLAGGAKETFIALSLRLFLPAPVE